MRREEALALLGLSTEQATDRSTVRSAYRRKMRAAHPDVNPAANAATRTASLSAAYRVLTEHQQVPVDLPHARSAGRAATRSHPGAPTRSRPARRRVAARASDSRTVVIQGGLRYAFAAVLEACHRLGEIGYLDSAAGLVEVVVEFVEEPTSSVVLSLAERRSGFVDVDCEVEPLSGGASPSNHAVTRLVAATLAAIDVEDLAL